MKFPIYGKVKNVPNHQPDAGFKKKQAILANLGLLDILIKGWQKRKTSPNFLEQ